MKKQSTQASKQSGGKVGMIKIIRVVIQLIPVAVAIIKFVRKRRK